MPRRIYIPDGVIKAIADHVAQAVDRAQDGMYSAIEDEDTLTGQLGACLRISNQQVQVNDAEIKGLWTWGIEYSKFRGRGRGATEKLIGADGIFELRVKYGSHTDSKSLLFQAKTEWDRDSDIVQQAIKLSTWREAAVIVNHARNGFESFSVDSVIASNGRRSGAREFTSLKAMLNDYFLKCKVGHTDLRYKPKERMLTWLTADGLKVATQFSIPKRLRIGISSPTVDSDERYDKVLGHAEVHKHRLAVEPEDVVSPLLVEAPADLTARNRPLALIYHPDRHGALDQLIRDIAGKRMQEVNAAYEKVMAKRKRE